jgi:superoxide dismutase, Cu-Zn family
MQRSTHRTARRLGVIGSVAAAALAVGVTVSVVSAESNGARSASAVIIDGTGETVGFATLVEDATGQVHVNVKVSGLSPGLHGLHVHKVGLCDRPSFLGASTHFNPTGAKHGGHGGDLPNMIVNEAGRGHLNAGTHGFTLGEGSASVFDADGSAIVIHAGPDDLMTDPTGNSGGRVACGVITPG